MQFCNLAQLGLGNSTSFIISMYLFTVLGQLPPRQLPSGQLPLDNYPPDNFPPRTNTPQTITPPDNRISKKIQVSTKVVHGYGKLCSFGGF